MKKFARVALLAILAVFILGNAYAAIPQLISFQGKLTNPSTGSPVSGSYQMTFLIYDAQTGGN